MGWFFSRLELFTQLGSKKNAIRKINNLKLRTIVLYSRHLICTLTFALLLTLIDFI